MTNPLIASLTRAVEAAPDVVALRLHLAELLLADGDVDAAVGPVSYTHLTLPTSDLV